MQLTFVVRPINDIIACSNLLRRSLKANSKSFTGSSIKCKCAWPTRVLHPLLRQDEIRQVSEVKPVDPG